VFIYFSESPSYRQRRLVQIAYASLQDIGSRKRVRVRLFTEVPRAQAFPAFRGPLTLVLSLVMERKQND
jgi:hypothetical protein